MNDCEISSKSPTVDDNDHVQYGDGFVHKLRMKFNQSTRINEQTSTAATNCCPATAVAGWRRNDRVTSLFLQGRSQTNHNNNCPDVVPSNSSVAHLSETPAAGDSSAMPNDKFSYSSAMSLTVEKDLAEDSECSIGIVASAIRLYESLSSPVVPATCLQSLTGSESTAASRQMSDSEVTSSGYRSLSVVTSSSTNSSSSSAGEFNDNIVTPVHLTTNIHDTAPSDASCVCRSDSDTATASDSASGRDEMLVTAGGSDAAKSNVTSDTVEVRRLSADEQLTALCSVEKVSAECVNDAQRAMIPGTDKDDQDDSQVRDKIGSMNRVHEETLTIHYVDLPSKHGTEPEISLNIYKTSISEYGSDTLTSETEERTDSRPAAQPLLSIDKQGELRTDCSFIEEQKSVCAGHLDGRNELDMKTLPVDCVTFTRSTNRPMRTVGRRRAAPIVKSTRSPTYPCVIHIGSQPDDVIIETDGDPPGDLSVTLNNRRHITQSVSLRLVELREQLPTGRPRRRVCRSAPQELLSISVVLCGSSEYVVRHCSEDDCGEWRNNSVDMVTSQAHLFTPATRRRQVISLSSTAHGEIVTC